MYENYPTGLVEDLRDNFIGQPINEETRARLAAWLQELVDDDIIESYSIDEDLNIKIVPRCSTDNIEITFSPDLSPADRKLNLMKACVHVQ